MSICNTSFETEASTSKVKKKERYRGEKRGGVRKIMVGKNRFQHLKIALGNGENSKGNPKRRWRKHMQNKIPLKEISVPR